MLQNSAPDRLFPRLLADVGGTNARFAWQAAPGAAISDVRILPCADHPTLPAAMHAYLDGLGRGQPEAAAIAIANPITGDHIRMTNHHWQFSQSAVKAEFGLQVLRLLNDFTALALALPDLQPHELRQVGGAAAYADAAIGLLGAHRPGVRAARPPRWRVPLEGEAATSPCRPPRCASGWWTA
jgi:glucokinase